MPIVKVDTRSLDQIGENVTKAKRQLIGQMAERGYQLLRKEVPIETGNLKQGVAPPEVHYENLTATLIVSARSGRTGARTATLFGADGTRKGQVSLRPQKSFNYAEAVARGRAAISPKAGRALLIPVPAKPAKGGYLMVGSQIFVMRKSARATAPNPFDERAAKQLETDAPKIAEAVLRRFLK
jgi:hypothetical protein